MNTNSSGCNHEFDHKWDFEWNHDYDGCDDHEWNHEYDRKCDHDCHHDRNHDCNNVLSVMTMWSCYIGDMGKL